MDTERFTHNGWFAFCPVKLGDVTDDPDKSLLLAARWWFLDPIFWLAEQWVQFTIGFCSLFFADYEPGFRIRITGERR